MYSVLIFDAYMALHLFPMRLGINMFLLNHMATEYVIGVLKTGLFALLPLIHEIYLIHITCFIIFFFKYTHICRLNCVLSVHVCTYLWLPSILPCMSYIASCPPYVTDMSYICFLFSYTPSYVPTLFGTSTCYWCNFSYHPYSNMSTDVVLCAIYTFSTFLIHI